MALYEIILSYAINKFAIMVNYDDTKFTTAVLKDYIDPHERFSAEQMKFNVGIGLYDN